jgi:hypothetical protein
MGSWHVVGRSDEVSEDEPTSIVVDGNLEIEPD